MVTFCFLFLCSRSIFPIHPSFRIIALAEPPVIGSTTQQWLGPEFLTMFFFHHMKPLVKSEEIQVIKEMVRVRPVLGWCLLLLSFEAAQIPEDCSRWGSMVSVSAVISMSTLARHHIWLHHALN